MRPNPSQLRARKKSWGERDGGVPVGYGVSANRKKFQRACVIQGYPSLPNASRTSPDEHTRLNPNHSKKPMKKCKNKRQYKNENSQSANERPTRMLARERLRQRERERESERGIGPRVGGMEVRDKTAADRAFLCTGITASRDQEHKGIISSEPECGVWMNETRRHQIARPCVRE